MKKNLILLSVFFTLGINAQPTGKNTMEPIGPTPIRFYTGNLSVGLFTEYWGTTTNDFGTMTDNLAKIMKRTSTTVMCDYLTWCSIEQKPGKWDWSAH